VVEYFESGRFDEIVLATPGPLGLLALAAARLLGVPVVALDYTDFSDHARRPAGSARLEDMTRRGMDWYLAQADRVVACDGPLPDPRTLDALWPATAPHTRLVAPFAAEEDEVEELAAAGGG
jgi:threonine dehydrogenase-like Zn-dependent dehydrogenase